MNLEKLKKNIEEKQICPKSKMVCFWSEFLVWISGIIFVVLGALDLATLFAAIREMEWMDYAKESTGMVSMIFMSIPILWIVLFTLFIIVSYKFYKNTKKGYKYCFWKILSITIILTIILGAVFYQLGWGHNCEAALEQIVMLMM